MEPITETDLHRVSHEPGRAAFEAERRGASAIEQALRGATPRTRIDFDAARQRELAEKRYTEPSAVLLARERRLNEESLR